MDDALKLLNNELIHVDFFADQVLCLILRVVSVPKAAILLKFELEELVSKFALVTHVVAKIELLASLTLLSWSLNLRCTAPTIFHLSVLAFLLRVILLVTWLLLRVCLPIFSFATVLGGACFHHCLRD